MLDQNFKKEELNSGPTSMNLNNDSFVDDSIEDVGKSTVHYFKKRPVYIIVPGIIFLVSMFSLIFYRVDKPGLYIFPIAFIFIVYSTVRNRVQHEFIKQFAKVNNFNYSRNGGFKDFKGSLFQLGHDRAVPDVVSGQYQNHSIALLNYQYVTGSGKHKQTHQYTAFRLQFDSIFPSLLLDNNDGIFGDSFFGIIPGRVPLKLEGNFNEHFSLSVAKEYEIEALQIFTPDLMIELIDKAKEFSLEMVGSDLFIYHRGLITTKNELYLLYGLVRYFIDKLSPVLLRMKPSLEAMEKYQFN